MFKFKTTQFDCLSKKHLIKIVKSAKKIKKCTTSKMIPVRTEMLENTLW